MSARRSWPTWLLVGGLAAVFAGARILDGADWAALPTIIIGSGAVVAATVWRFAAWRAAQGDERSVAAVFFLGYSGCALALAGYLPGTEGGLELLGLEFEGVRDRLRFQRFFLVASPIALAGSLLPVLGAHWALARGGSEGAARVDAMRVREVASGALSTALGGSALVLIAYTASALNQTADFSYFKTSRPGEAVREIALNLDGALEAALFFPEVNAVKDEVRNYLDELARATGKVTIAEYDRYADPDAAADFNARSDGTVFLRVGDRTEEIGLLLDLNEARGRLRVFDSHVQQALLQLNRSRRFAYLTKGHGEFNDPLSADEPGEGQAPSLRDWRPGMDMDDLGMGPPLGALRNLLEFLNYEVRDIGIGEGLGVRIPDDAAMLMILGPQRAFLEAEMDAVREYLDRGGSLLVAMETGSEFRLDDLRDRLGLDYEPTMTIDDQSFVSGRPPSAADRRFIVTNNFSTHPSVTTPGRRGGDVLMVGPGSLRVADDVPGLRASLVVNSPRSSYADLDGDYRYDEGVEERGGYGLAAAVERDGAVGGAEADADAADADGGANPRPGMRALVYGDAEIFSDQILATLRLNADLVADGIRWLGREEEFAGEVVSEEDVPILHTRSEDVAWFYAIIFGAPTAVLAAGVFVLRGRRRRAAPDGGGSGGRGGGGGGGGGS